MSTVAVGGRYIVEGSLGRGGMAAVFRARDAQTGKSVALKRTRSRDPVRAHKRRSLLEREFHTLAHLRHPRIIEVYDFGVDDAGPFYTMELLDGVDLDQAGALPWRIACGVLHDVASSLAILHSRGLLHRDVSARNVRLTAGGRAKLLDFGTMVSIGVVDVPIGTPPFMAPEALQMQALDARADLYSLGALAYYVLVGRHAYPASRPSDLRDAWRSRPMPPQRANPEIPAALSALVLSLLSLDRAARPQSAAEVMERLRAIAELPSEDLPAIARAYLTTPSLVGREKALVAVRTRMLSLVRGEGDSVIVEGPPGSGRSRMLDACAFEAKLLGTHVARVSGTDAAGEPWTIVRQLCSQLFTLFPDDARAASRLASNVLQYVIDEVAPFASSTVSTAVPERSVILRELRDFILTLGRRQRLLLVIDDADRVDEASLALLAAVADKCGDASLMLVLAMGPDAAQTRSAPLSLLRSLAHRVELPPLDEDQTLALLKSVFGDVTHLQPCAARIHALGQGSPRATMEFAQHLVDRGLARYEVGHWTLPPRLDDGDLPATLLASLELRLAQLSPDARELAAVLALADGQRLSLDSYASLTSHGDATRMYAALEELATARVLVAAADEHRFSQRSFIPLIADSLSAVESRAVHARIADYLDTHAGDPLQRAHHAFHAGRELAAIEILCGLDLQQKPPPLGLLEDAVRYAERHASQLAARTVHRLRMALLSQASLLLAVDSFQRCLTPIVQQLERDTGLALYRELGELPPADRLSQALARQQQRYLATPEREQVYSVGEAIRELARLTGATCSMAASVMEPALLDRLPSLEPLLPLSPALDVVSRLERATRGLMLVQGEHAAHQYEAVLARIAAPDRAGLDDSQFRRTQFGVTYGLALIESAAGLPRTEERAKVLESHRALRVAAWRVRSVLALNQGNVALAQRNARRAELLRLQDESPMYYAGTEAVVQLSALFRLGDLMGVKSALDALRALGRSYPGWRSFLPYAECCYQLLQGDAHGALARIAPECAALRPGVDPAFAASAYQHVRVLRELGATPESIAVARGYVEAFERHALRGHEPFLLLELSLLEAQAGEFDAALRRLEPVIRAREAAGASGLALGMFYEARARIALLMADRAGFARFAAQCASEYAKGQSPHLNVMYARLCEDARLRDLVSREASSVPEMLSLKPVREDADVEALRNRIAECVDAADRARCALTLLLQSTDSYLGHLYGVEESGLVPLAGLPDTAAEPALEGWLAGWVIAERDRAREGHVFGTATYSSTPPPLEHEDATRSLDGQDVHPGALIYTSREGTRYLASALFTTAGQTRTLVALLAVQITGDHLPNPPLALCSQLAALLLEHGDVAGLKLVAAEDD